MGRYLALAGARAWRRARRLRRRVALVGRRPRRAFWRSVWDHFDVRLDDAARAGPRRRRACPARAGSPARALNYAEHALRLPGRAGRTTSSSALSQTRERVDAHRGRAARRRSARVPRPGCAASASRRGDRVAAYAARTSPRRSSPSSPRASLGAIWSSCAPEFGARCGDRPAGARSSRRCCSPSTATATATKDDRPRRPRSPPSAPPCPSVRARRRVAVPRPRRPSPERSTGASCSAEPGEPLAVRAGAVRPPAVRALLARARPGCPSRSSTATAASCSST